MNKSRLSSIKLPIISIVILFLFYSIVNANETEEIYLIQPAESLISGSIRYTVIGKYVAEFNDYIGEIHLSSEQESPHQVFLKIQTKSLKSPHPALDRIVLSRRLLDAQKFPQIIFKGQFLKESQGDYFVSGELDLHGVKKDIKYPFLLKGPFEDKGGRYILVEGRWILNRKDFGIIWSQLLDRGGILVANHFTVSFQLKAIQK